MKPNGREVIKAVIEIKHMAFPISTKPINNNFKKKKK
jgi:hypothetical protein